MNSIQLVRLLDVASITKVREAVGVSPRSLFVQGRDFKSVEQVLINGMAAPTFIVLSETELLVEVPEPLRQAIITEVTVLSHNLTLTERSLVEFTFGTRPKRVRGVLRLMQNFLRLLLRTPGSNLFHRRSGGGLLSRVGGTVARRSAADVQLAINLTKQYIIGAQTPVRQLSPSERLLEAEISGLTADPANTAIYVTVVLTNHSGQRAGATLVT
jgi:hypothetical protein